MRDPQEPPAPTPGPNRDFPKVSCTWKLSSIRQIPTSCQRHLNFFSVQTTYSKPFKSATARDPGDHTRSLAKVAKRQSNHGEYL